MHTSVITESASGGVFDVPAGHPVTLELEEIPGTGDRWMIEPDPAVAVERAELAPHAGAAPGGGGVRRFVVTPREPGDVTVRARLWRDWEGEGSILKRFEVTLRAR